MADSNANDKMKEEILLSKRMFFAGCLGLPWLWICNALYFRLRVFGPLVMVDYYPGHDAPSSSSTPGEDTTEGGNTTTNNDDRDNQQQQAMQQELERQMEEKELVKWVKRSTWGALVAMSAFVAWIVTFQVNQEHFGPKWFVMDETDAEVTGW
jgi:hypothetical protein